MGRLQILISRWRCPNRDRYTDTDPNRDRHAHPNADTHSYAAKGRLRSPDSRRSYQ